MYFYTSVMRNKKKSHLQWYQNEYLGINVSEGSRRSVYWKL